MARPKKFTVDYFPHDAYASEGKTLTILFNNFGHEGISFWWQLLENISKTNNHVIGIRNPEETEFLAAKMHFTVEKLKAILDKLASLNAIDPELYRHDLIWSQNLVDRLLPVYSTRRMELPSKPEFITQETEFITQETEFITPENPQTKLKELKETKLNNSVSGERLPEWIDGETWDAFLLMRKKAKAAPTDKAQELLIKDLEKFRAAGDDPNEVLNQSIKNGWRGLFPLKNNGGNGNGKGTGHFDAANGRTQYTKPPVPFVG